MDEKDLNFEESKRLCIITLDPENKGGILLMMSFFYRMARENNLTPFLVYNIVPSLRNDENCQDITFLKFLKGHKPKICEEEKYNMKGLGIERVLPEFEFLNYILNKNLWEKILKDQDNIFVIGGNNLCAMPCVLLKKSFSLWVASTLYEDRIDRIKREKFIRKLRDYVSLPILLCFEKIIFKKAEKIFALSNYTKNKIIEKYKIDSDKIEIIPYPVDTNKFYPLDFFQRKNDYLLFTGRFNDERKNIFLLLKAFAEVHSLFPNLKLKLVGDKPNKSIIDFLNKNKINDFVEIIDFLKNEELINFYQNALLFIIPSYQEGLCISGLEAMSCGIPVISTKCGGPEDYVKDGYNGFLVGNNNLKELKEAIIKYINLNEAEKIKMSQNARNYIVENFSVEIVWQKFSEYLKI